MKLHFTLSGRVLNICVKSEPKNQAKASKKVEYGRHPPHIQKPSLLLTKNTRARGSCACAPTRDHHSTSLMPPAKSCWSDGVKCKLDLRAGNVGSGAVCMYYLHLSDVVIEAQCC